jgi:hypothetical protein
MPNRNQTLGSVRLAPVTLYQMRHERFDGDAGHKWLRNELVRIARDL